MPTIHDPSVVRIHYGDPEAETGAIGGDFVGPGMKDYSFIIDRGSGVDASQGPAAGRDAFARMSVFKDGNLVAETQPGAENNGLRVAPSSYRDWAALGALECAVKQVPEQANDKGISQSYRDQFTATAAIENSRER